MKHGHPSPLYRVEALLNAGGTQGQCQVQVLEPNQAGEYSVVRVWPGDAAHLALWQELVGMNIYKSAMEFGGEDDGSQDGVEKEPAGE